MKQTRKQKSSPISRRNFLHASAGYAVMASTPLASSMLSLGMSSAAAAAPAAGYKALVCIFLHGGADSYNMLIPTNNVAYTDYQTARGSLALDRSDLLTIGDGADSSRQYGLHPGMTGIRDIYTSGKLAFVANTGPLVEPTDMQGYFGNQPLPLGLFSHNDQRKHWQSAEPHWRNARSGWAGRMSELINDASASSLFANVAVGGTTLMQTGSSVSPYVVNAFGNRTFSGYGTAGSGADIDRAYTDGTDQMLAARYEDIFRQTYADITADSIDASFEYRSATSPTNVKITTPFPFTKVGNALRQVAYGIGARNTLDQSRQVFFLNMPGWDHHDDMLTGMDKLVAELSEAMQAFYAATEELGVANDVVTFTASDFGRTLSSNGDGSDHAWGGNYMVMGGAVNGGRLYGSYPESLVLGNDLDIGRGRMIPTTSTDEYNAELARWFGIANNSDLELILPNIRNFYSSAATEGPLGIFT